MRVLPGGGARVISSCASLAVLWILIVQAAHGQNVGGYRDLRRTEGSRVIRARLSSSSGLRLRPVSYEPIFGASSAIVTAAPGGYSYPRPQAVTEASTEGQSQQVYETSESPDPSTPMREFMDILKIKPVVEESEQRIDSEAVTPSESQPEQMPVRVMAMIQNALSADAAETTVNNHNNNGDDHHGHDVDSWPEGYKGVIPGEQGVDYPIYSSIPETGFSCGSHQYSGYYADEETRCQVFHVCLRRPSRRTIEKWSFLCPNGTVFSQEEFVCVWWNNAPTCDSATLEGLYQTNVKLGWDSHDESGTTSIKNIMESMVQSPVMPMLMTTTPIAAPIPEPTPAPRLPAARPTIPITLTANFGSGRSPVTLTTSVPITMVTKNMIITSNGEQITYSSQDQEQKYESEQDIDSQAITGVRSQSEVQQNTKSGSNTEQSESEAYELRGKPSAISPPEPLIVNRRPEVARPTEAPQQEPKSQEVIDFGDYEAVEEDYTPPGTTSATEKPVPTVVMMPVEQTFSDGSKAIIDMPVLMMVRPGSTRGYSPVAISNPNGVTIPNFPLAPPRTYLPPKRDPMATSAPPTTSEVLVDSQQVTTNRPSGGYLPPKKEEPEPSVDYEYEKDKSPEGSRPIVDFSENPQTGPAVAAPTTTETPAPVGHTYLPPRPETTTAATQPPPVYEMPEVPTTQKQYVEPPTPEPVTEKIVDSQPQQPSGGYLPPPVQQQQMGYTYTNGRPRISNSGTFVAMDGSVINQILGNAGIKDEVQDGQQISGFSAQPGVETTQNNRAQKPAVVYDDHVDANTLEKLEKLMHGYIDLPVGPGPNPTQISQEIPGTDGVQAFLSSQKNVDPKQTLEIFNFGKYAIFMPANQVPAGMKPGMQQINSSPESLFGPRAKDVMPQIMDMIARQNAQVTGGYGGSSSDQSGIQIPVPQKPSGLYGPPTKEFQSSSQKQQAPGGYQAEITVQTTVERRPVKQQQVAAQAQRPQGGYQQMTTGAQASAPQGGYQQQSSSQAQAPQGGYQQSSSSSQAQAPQGGYQQQPSAPAQAPQGGYQQSSSSSQAQAPQGGYQQSSSSSQAQAPQGGYQQSSSQSSAPQGGNQQQSSSSSSSQTQAPQGGYQQSSSSSQAQAPQGGYQQSSSSSQAQAPQQGGYTSPQQAPTNPPPSPQPTQQQQSQQSNGYRYNQPQTPLSTPSATQQTAIGYELTSSSSSPSAPSGPSAPANSRDPRPFRPSEPDPGLFMPLGTSGAPLRFSSQFQLPIVVETHSSQHVPFRPSASPAQYPQQTVAPPQAPPAAPGTPPAPVPYNQQRPSAPPPPAPIVPPTPHQPSGLYTPPTFDPFSAQRAPIPQQQQQQPTPNAIPQQPQVPQQQQQHQQHRFPAGPELIQAIPVHDATYVETRPIAPTGYQRVPYATAPQVVHPQHIVTPVTHSYLPPAPPQLQQHHQPQFHHQQPQIFNPQPTGYHTGVSQFQQQIHQQQQHQTQFPQLTFQQAPGSPSLNLIPSETRNPKQVYFRPNVQQQQQHQQPQQPHHQQFHQNAHQQHIQQFLQNQRIRSVNQPQLQHSNNAQVNHHQNQQRHLQHQQQRPQPPQPSRAYGTGSGPALEPVGAFSSNKYQVFYPGKDKSQGVKLTY